MYALSLLLVCTVCISINCKTSKEACGSYSFSEAQNACLVRIGLFYLLNLGTIAGLIRIWFLLEVEPY